MTKETESRKISVLGTGGWGTALAILLHEKGHRVTLWGATPDYVDLLRQKRENSKYLKGFTIPTDLTITSKIEDAQCEANIIVVAIPTPYVRSILEKGKDSYIPGTPLVSVIKGIENETLMRSSEIIIDVLGKQPVILLFGPSHAEEVAKRLPTTVVVASEDDELARETQNIFMTNRFRVYTNPDVIGVELGGSLKNVIAIAAGICEGLGFGDNSKAALLTRGLSEIIRLGVAMGGRRETFSGLTGLGDLITTCVSPFGRNRFVGEQIAKGKKLSQLLTEMNQVAEGIRTTKSVCKLAKKFHVEMPITSEIYKVLFEDKDPMTAVNELMVREPKSEIEFLP
ncbi:MAG: glycerol-3-phosphate dehydrogenase [NAD(P)+] [Candidatus Scalindua sp.]|nr:MAG: NAD(P)H-dependent glycerol-3-phosphate dehydrogenase [Candidatus Scalindua sp.]NOG83950.1 NAD(P)H-dependent glycerol-3-phosphate dehydrogenase [Planctomycetota bacterium]RZV88022.1 MAG: NAD(P)H-dependent glycerol-3-phosphate dehydrogenase [Candidatus Scalindua sp. SCAELEC01]GJQ58400.1 MAG: glycerol-3-phosphate dehydrogenase [NAD(P)+] [Candidatus Scalindua sp.]